MGRLIDAANKMAGTSKTGVRPSTKDKKPAASPFGKGNPNTSKTQPDDKK